jgi:hypothetical protein
LPIRRQEIPVEEGGHTGVGLPLSSCLRTCWETLRGKA